MASAAAAAADEAPSGERRYVIGYALAPKKQQSFIQPSLLSRAAGRGIELVSVDPSRPLPEQGPFHLLIHKLYGEDWRAQLDAFSGLHPSVPVVDPPHAIDRLHNRISMLQVVSELDVPLKHDQTTFGIPSQVVVYDAAALADSGFLAALRFPLIAKPLVADGTAKSHKMSLVYHRDGLRKLRPPLVLQEFVNHGGIIFKVYVVGAHVTCVKRRSLPDVSSDALDDAASAEGSVSFSQVSNLPTERTAQEYYDDMRLEDAVMPPTAFINDIAAALRRALGLQLFNFDMIRDVRAGDRYLVIDINYFPGYAKMPGYETVLTDFFWEMVHPDQDAAHKEEEGDKGSNHAVVK